MLLGICIQIIYIQITYRQINRDCLNLNLETSQCRDYPFAVIVGIRSPPHPHELQASKDFLKGKREKLAEDLKLNDEYILNMAAQVRPLFLDEEGLANEQSQFSNVS